MKTSTRFILASLGALLAGALWWAAYSPTAWSLPALLGIHLLLAWALAAALTALGWSSRAALAIGLLMGLLVAPLAISPYNAAGLLGGKSGALANVGVVALGLALGGALGQLMSRKRAIGGALTAGAVLASAGACARGVYAIPTEAQPTALADDSINFPQGPALVYGIDGADWQVLDPLIEAGELPHLQSLIDRGRRGVLRSMDPMASPVIWTTIFTGQNPSTHGLEDWNRSDARSRTVPMLWDIFGVHNRSSLTVNVPGTWPPTDVNYGTMLSGFPMPGLASADKGLLSGVVLTTTGSSGYVATTTLETDGNGFSASVTMAAPEITSALPHISNGWIDVFGRERMIPSAGYAVDLRVKRSPQGVVITGELGQIELTAGQWSGWRTWKEDGVDARMKIYALQADDQGIELYLSPAFQSPTSPRHAFATGIDDLSVLEVDGQPYIPEGIGWTTHRDERLAHIVPELIFDVQEMQLAAAERQLEGQTLDLVSVVFTATDRIQHPYWSLHEPEAYTWTPPASIAGQDYVVDAYKRADEGLGRLLAKLPDNALVFIVSDHGVSAADPSHKTELGEAGHRSDGVWIAAGGAVIPSADMVEIGVADVTPTLLYCMGAPVAQDFDGRAAEALCEGSLSQVASYLGSAGTGGAVQVEGQSMDQIKSLGYMED